MQVRHVQEQISGMMSRLAASHKAASALLPREAWPEYCSEEPHTCLPSKGAHSCHSRSGHRD